MEHFYLDIQGWFDFDNIYKDMILNLSDGSHVVEVGSWKGKSAAFMCVEILNSGKQIKFDCVDIWSGAGEDGEYSNDNSVISQTLYDEFLKNMEPVIGLYTPIREWSDKAASRYNDGALDFVFIDAGHSYENVIADITAWLPKVKKGGVIGGHDYSHAAGVKKAVNEVFTSFVRDKSSWIVTV
jgi:cephalosporin hydroxylase